MHMRLETVRDDGTHLFVELYQCATTKQYMVQQYVDTAEVRTMSDVPKYRLRHWLARYDNPHDACQRFALATTDVLRQAGMGTTDWGRQLVAADANITPNYAEGLRP